MSNNPEPRFEPGNIVHVIREDHTIPEEKGAARYRMGTVLAEAVDGYYRIGVDAFLNGSEVVHPYVESVVQEKYLRSPEEMKEAFNREPVRVPPRDYGTTAETMAKKPVVMADLVRGAEARKKQLAANPLGGLTDTPEEAEMLEAMLDAPTETAFTKFDHDKPHLAYLPIEPLEMVARVLDHGAVKYDRDNWKKCDDPMRYMSAAMRHQFAWLKGEQLDPETGQNHLAHALCSLMFLLWMDIQEK